MKNLGEEIIEVGGKEYKLFLNRKGIVAFERDSKEYQEQASLNKNPDELKASYEKPVKKADNDNPFEGLEAFDELETDYDLSKKIMLSLYRIMLYKYHPMTRTEAKEWFDSALKEYGLNQLAELGNQMIRDVNSDGVTDESELKKLTALRQAKK